MNDVHMKLCASPWWAEHVETKLLPWVLDEVLLGEHLLEVGPGPGLTTDVLRGKAPRMTALEINPQLAEALATRMRGTNVKVVRGDGTRQPFETALFSAAASFTMLHHVPTAELQDRLLAETARVLRPGGLFVGSDSVDSDGFRQLHVDDICVPVDPATFPDRLRAAGFEDVAIEVDWRGMRFLARKPQSG
ncbi:MAG: methyltransferase domain-containing protein [Chloroflexi bacterium]|nr:methyltransferase domain-containing protein [Chloroflexota bacterium]